MGMHSLLGMHNYLAGGIYFPVAFALKTSLAFFGRIYRRTGLGAVALLKGKDKRFLWILFPFAIYAGMSMSSISTSASDTSCLPIPFSLLPAESCSNVASSAPRPASRDHIRLRDFSWMAVEVLRTYPIRSLHESTGVQSPALVVSFLTQCGVGR